MTNPRIAYRMSSTRKRLSPPDGKPLIVHLVVNVEISGGETEFLAAAAAVNDSAEDRKRPSQQTLRQLEIAGTHSRANSRR